VLYALEHPPAFGVLLLSFVVGITLPGCALAWVAQWRGDRRPAQEGRLKADPRRQVDPFGAVAALIGGLGWTRPVELQQFRRKDVLVAVTLLGPAVNLILGAGLLLLWRFVEGPGDPGGVHGGAAYVLQHGAELQSASDVLLLVGCSQLYLGALSLVLLPPLDGGRLLFGLAPRTQGWLKAEYQLVERNIGVAVLLALLLVPLGGPVPVLPDVLDALLWPLLRVLIGA
jgi:membrane-associated protease RseP (regulator of RpoE activity)